MTLMQEAAWNSGNSRNGAYYRKIDTQFGKIEIQVPRDRNGKFHQHTLPDYKQHSDVLEDMVIKLYSKGVTIREIADLIEKMYGSHYSAGQVSNISKQMVLKIEAYHKRGLSDKFFCVYLDATYLPLRRQTFERKAVYIAIGIKPNGHKEVIDYCIAPNENIEVWTEMLQNMKSRGLKQVELFLSDGIVGIVEAYPKAHFQRCLVHVMRNICTKVRVDDREAVMNDFYAKQGKLYSHVVRNLKAIEADMLVFYNYPKQIRPPIYSTNMINRLTILLSVKLSLKLNFQQSNHWTYLQASKH